MAHAHIYDSSINFVTASDGLGPIYSLQCSCGKWAYYRPPLPSGPRQLRLKPVAADEGRSSKIESPYNPSALTPQSVEHLSPGQRVPDGNVRRVPRLASERERGNQPNSRQSALDEYARELEARRRAKSSPPPAQPEPIVAASAEGLATSISHAIDWLWLAWRKDSK